MTTMEYESENRFEDEPRFDPRDRSRSPRRDGRDDRDRGRSDSPNGRMSSRGPPPDSRAQEEKDPSARNPGSNLFVTGIHPRLTETDVTRLFEKYGEVEKASIMLDPHTKESRGFGFVKMVTPEQAQAAKDGLQGENIEGRTLSIEMARRARPRTPTPGKYFGPPKRDFRGPPPRGYGGREYRDDRRRDGYGGGGGGGGYGRDDSYRGGGGYSRESRGDSRYDREDRDRGDRYSSGRREGGRGDDYASRGIDRYASRDDRYSDRGRDSRYGESGSRDAARGSDDRYEERYTKRKKL